MAQSRADSGRLVILGGGIAALTTAFYASERDWRLVFPGGIHVYEKTDVLGGKGASRRNDGNQVKDRIEEHGLHVWFGYYDNAFALLSKCHEYLEDEAKHKHYERWSTALRDIAVGFRPCSRIGIMDYDGAAWNPWVADFPEDSTEQPWEPRPSDPAFGTPSTLIVRALQLAETFLYSIMGRVGAMDEPHTTLVDASILPIPIKVPQVARISNLLDAIVSNARPSASDLELLSFALGGIARLATEVRYRLDEQVRRHSGLRRTWYMVDVLLAAVRGLIDDGVVSTGSYEWIDGLDLRAWLVLHGASEESVSSGVVKTLVYDLGFAYEDGDAAKPSCSAATGVYGILRLILTYRGAVMWKMNAGMGEIVFAPIYEALVRRGVQFHFGEEVKRLELANEGEGKRATHIVFEQTPVDRSGRLPSLHLTEGQLVGTLPYWGSAPKPSARPARRHTLALGRHDMVVFGMPVGTLDEVTLPRQRPARWSECAVGVKTVATAAVQLWLDAPVTRYAPWATPDITVCGYTEPFDTWGDMKTLSGETPLPGAKAPQSVAYLTNVAPNGADETKLAVKVDEFLKDGLSGMWPGYTPDIVLDHYVRFNMDATSRYTLSLPGSMQARLSPADDSIANVRPVGDWTRTSFSAGCIESAVISGMIAARVLRPDRPLPIFGEGPEHAETMNHG